MNDRLTALHSMLTSKDSPVGVETLLDTVIAIHDDIKEYPNVEKNSNFLRFLQKSKLKSLRVNKEDYTFIRRLARGQFGEVALVRGKTDNKVYAMKILKKSEMVKQADVAFFMEERMILSLMNPKWITKLFASFQDESSLYLIMDYLPGGDLGSLILKADEGLIHINDESACFYIAEITLALEELHKLNYVHRDLKPANILLDSKGHVKLADFGSCIQLDSSGSIKSKITVGTPDYISPEVLMANEGRGSYDKRCDFWSLGITLFELLFLDPPFYADSLVATYNQIMNHKSYFALPDDVKVDQNTEDLLRKLVCDQKDRLKDVEEIKSHPFFKKIDWENLHLTTPPFIPSLKSEEDVSNFADLEDDDDNNNRSANTFQSRDKTFQGVNLSFIGYTYNRNYSISSILSPNVPMMQKEKSISFPHSQSFVESDIKNIKKAIIDEKRLKEKEETVEASERERKKIQIELDSLQKKHQNLKEEKASLEVEVGKLNDSLKKEADESRNYKLSAVNFDREKQRLENNIKSLQEEIELQLKKVSQLKSDIDSNNREKAVNTLEISRLKTQLEAEIKNKESFQDRLTSTEKRIAEEQRQVQDSVERLSLSQKIVDELKIELENSQIKLQKEFEEKSSLLLKIEEIEAAKLDVLKNYAQLEAKFEKVNDSLLETTNSSSAEAQYLQELTNKLETETELKKKLEVEFSGVSQELLNLKNKLTAKERLLSEIQNENSHLKHQLEDAEDKLKAEKKDRDKEKSMLDSQIQQKNALESKYNDMSRENGLYIMQLEDMKKKVEEMDGENRSIELKLKTNQLALEEQINAKNTADLKFVELQKQFDSINNQYTRTSVEGRKLSQLKSIQEGIISDQTKSLALLEMEREELNQKTEQYLKEKMEMETELSTLVEKFEEMERNSVPKIQFEFKSDMLEKAEKALADMSGRYAALEKRLCVTLGEHTGVSVQTSSGSHRFSITEVPFENLSGLNVADIPEEEKRQTTVRTNMSKVKVLEQKLNNEVVKRTIAEEELAKVVKTKNTLELEVEELKKQLAGKEFERTRSPSTNSVSNLASTPRIHNAVSGNDGISLPRLTSQIIHEGNNESQSHVEKMPFLKRLRPLLFPDNPAIIVISGWLKFRVMRTTLLKKNRWEWQKKHVVLRNSKLFMSDREKSKEELEPLVDLRCDTFIVREAKQNELIHMTPKEIQCVFTIQAASFGSSVYSSIDSVSPEEVTYESVQKKVAAIERNIEKESKFKNATEKMAQAVSGDQKKRILVELEECIRRLKLLKQERFELQKTLKEMPSSASGNENTIATQDRMVSISLEVVGRELDKRESYRKKVESLLLTPLSEKLKTDFDTQLSQLNKEINILRRSTQHTTEDEKDEVLKSVNKLLQKNSTVEYLGHIFRLKEATNSTTCYHCHDTLFGTSASYECSNCHLLTHKFCHGSIKITCQEYISLRNSMKWYFMASDEREKNRWIIALECVRGNVKEEARLDSQFDIDYLMSEPNLKMSTVSLHSKNN